MRIEDADTERCLPGMGERILRQLADCALLPDEEPVWQTARTARYEAALARLRERGLAYPCGCSRKDIDEALARLGQRHERHGERVYPGTCRDGLHGKPARAWRFATQKFEAAAPGELHWTDRRLGDQGQDVSREVGDFVLRRADGPWAYQLAVVVDDADQGVSDVVRGEDLADNTARQILLQRALGLPTPRYLHTPLVRGADGHKLEAERRGGLRHRHARGRARRARGGRARARPGPRWRCLVRQALAGWVPAWRALYNSRPQ